jgi:hypothetical protein
VSLVELSVEYLALNLSRVQGRLERLPLDVVEKVLEYIKKNELEIDPSIMQKLNKQNV